jgi:outer membrane protein assembly factor BamC
MSPNTPASPAALRLLVALGLAGFAAGCSTSDFAALAGSDPVDYKSRAVKTNPLEVPPDLQQLPGNNRNAPQSASISAAARQGAVAAAPAATAATATPVVSTTGAVTTVTAGNMRIERSGDQRWLVVDQTPEQLWPKVKAFWLDRGFTLLIENREAGVMETDWAENRAKLDSDIIRQSLGRFLGSAYSTGERDKYRTRIERTATGSEIFISHRGMVEVYTSATKDNTAWTQRPSEPHLEADSLARLMVALGTPNDAARAAVAAAQPRPERARVLSDQPGAALQVDDSFERAWRRVGVALDRAGFTVEDRDRAGGLYFVRYIDPKTAAKSEPGLLTRAFGIGGPPPEPPPRYRIALKGEGDKTLVSVLDAKGSPEGGEVGQRIVSVLVEDLK